MGKILLIEQTNMLQIRLENLFSKMGYKEIKTYDGLPILSFENFYNSNNGFNDIIIDLDQFRDSFELIINSIHTKDHLTEPNIIILTENTNYREITNIYTKGIDNIILKPFSDELILKKLSKNLDNENSLMVKEKIKGEERVLNWCTKYEIGIEEIDNDHKNIIEHYEKLYELMKIGKGHEYRKELIVFLSEYIDVHFRHEEVLQEKIDYKDIKSHISMHQDFKSQVEKLIAQLDDENISNSELIKLNLYIKNWIADHILIEDKKIASYLNLR